MTLTIKDETELRMLVRYVVGQAIKGDYIAIGLLCEIEPTVRKEIKRALEQEFGTISTSLH